MTIGPENFSSLYVHFPFCETKCHYCDFYSLGKDRTSDRETTSFQRALEQESALWSQRWPVASKKVKTIFFGGGTPSMTPPEQMESALAPLFLQDRVADDVEWTMEANPSSVQRDHFERYQKLGVNRVSMGVQAMRDDLLLKLGRVHSKKQALGALHALFESGITRVSVDLLCGVPGQSLKDIENALEELCAFPIQHLSCYLLTLPKKHPMAPSLPHEDEQLSHLLFLDRWMTERGFVHYEISNFARPGFEAQHNLAYWKGQSYLGLGPSAHSYSNTHSQRWRNKSSLHAYAQTLNKGDLPVEEIETLTRDQLQLEKWLLGLRLADGVELNWFDSSLKKSRLDQYIRSGWMEVHPQTPNRIRLTPTGFALSDQVISQFASLP